MQSILRIVTGTLAVVVGLLLIAVIGIYLLFWSSLPKYDGSLSSNHLKEELLIERDGLGVPYIKAKTRESISYGVGFCQGQDRFFQMDLQRRAAAGELSALFGPNLLEADTELRVHGFRDRAKLLLENLPEHEIEVLRDFTRGVNEGLASLKTRPPEYWLINAKPEPWKPEDSILIIYTFYLDLQNNPGLDYARWVARQTLPDEVVAFLDQPSHSWEAAIDGSQLLDLKIPGPDAFSYLKASGPVKNNEGIPDMVERMPGSNNWVVGPKASVTGSPIIANDPHLNLGVPNTWYKLSYSYLPEGETEYLDIHGFTIPGMPGIVIGTNGTLAWAVTNSSLDVDDLIILEPGPNGFPEYKMPSGVSQIQYKKEVIQVKGADTVSIEVPFTQWGPIIGNTPTGEKRVRRWAAYHPEAGNMQALMTENYKSAEEFISNSQNTNLPVQNYVLADTEGHIGWTIAGFLPDRKGADPYEAIYSSKADNVWTEKLAKGKWPSLIDPENQRIWTANNRIFGDGKYKAMGSGDFSEFPRAYQIREKLFALDKHSARSLADIQHDNSVVFLKRWQSLLLQTLERHSSNEPIITRIQEEVRNWNGRAEIESYGYTFIRDFRNRLTVEVLRHITQPCLEFDPENFDPFRFMTEEAIYQIVYQQPDYLLNPVFDSWENQFSYVVDEIVKSIHDRGWEAFKWGNRNQSDYSHPITYGVPILSRLLNMPKIGLSGDHYCPKVLSYSLASGVRMVISPGKLEDSIFQMGCGQSGHPISPHYRDLHKIWSTEEYLPFLPGEPEQTLTIHPEQ